MNKVIILICLTVLTFSACKKESKVLEENIKEIEQYVADNNLSGLQRTESGLHYIISQVGDGNHPTINDNVKVNYKGYLTNKEVFDQRPNAEFPLSNVIEGWQEGIPKFSRGGSGYLFIPSKLGYGSRGSGPIPGNAVLIFEIDLVDF